MNDATQDIVPLHIQGRSRFGRASRPLNPVVSVEIRPLKWPRPPLSRVHEVCVIQFEGL